MGKKKSNSLIGAALMGASSARSSKGNPFGGKKARKNAELVLASLLGGGKPSKKSKFEREYGSYLSSSRPGLYGGSRLNTKAKREEQKQQAKTDKAWDKVLKKLKIKDYDSASDTADVFRYVSGGGSSRGGSSRGGGGSNRPSNRTSGKYSDIKGALREDEAAGYAMADGLAGKDIAIGGWPSALEDLLLQQQNAFNDQLMNMQYNFNNQLGGLQGQLASANQAYAQAQQGMQAQLASAEAARQAAEQRAMNMRNAFVPQANPTALSVSYGDQRTSTRRAENNQLSDLTILSGLGTASAPLAGLQLA